MSVKKAPVRRAGRVYRPRSTAGVLVESQAPTGESEKSDGARRKILDATVGCFAEYGWSGTNMSVIARRSQMTRGRIQYYFPTLDDLLRAAIDHLMIEWRKRYFSSLSESVGVSARFETGISALWKLMQDPLQVAKQELEASARANPELRAMLKNTRVDEASFTAAKEAYPELAQYGDAELRRARDFTMVFMEGLTLHRFSSDAEARREDLIEMLKEVLIAFWSAVGVRNLESASRPKPPAEDAALDEDTRVRALALIQEAASLLTPTTAR